MDEDGFIPALEQMTGPSVPFIEELCVDTVKLPHAGGEISVGSLDEEVIVVGHEAVGVTDPIVAFIDMLEGIEKFLAVLIVFKNRFLLVTAGGHMIDRAGVFNAKRTSHGGTIAENWRNGKKVDLTLRCPRHYKYKN